MTFSEKIDDELMSDACHMPLYLLSTL